MQKTVSAPLAIKKSKVVTSLHNEQRVDDYAWLRADNWREVMQKPDTLPIEIRQYIEAENAYLQSMMADTESLQDQLFNEMKGRIEEDYQSVPIVDGNYAYYYQYTAGQQYPIFCRYLVTNSTAEEILLDGNKEANKHQYFQIGELQQSPNHQWVAYSLDTEGSEMYSIYVLDTNTYQLLAEVIHNVQGEVVWSNDSQYIFYITLDDEHRPDKVYRHCIGTTSDCDVMVYQEQDKGFFINLDKTRSKRFITINIHAHETSECYLIDADAPLSEPQLVRARQAKIEYEVEHHTCGLLIRTNIDDADNYKIMRCQSINDKNWYDIYIPPNDTLLDDMLIFKDWLVCCEYFNSLPQLCIYQLNDQGVLSNMHKVAFDEECYDISVEENEQYAGNTLRFSYASMTTPERIYDYDMQCQEKTLLKEQLVPSGHRTEDYVTRRLFAEADDGEKIPISLLYAKSSPPTNDSPLLLYGYGAYGHTVPTTFSTTRLSLVNRGFVFVIAHIRGGMEKGYRWYEEGKMENKKSTFTDFITCSEYLCNQGFTSPSKLSIYGGSAGGMLIGAVLNMRPELFHSALADVPFVDVLTTMCDESLPLTPAEWVEWGNQIQSSSAYQRMASYSPYDNVGPYKYPHILVTAGISDPRVTYWEPAKWVAKLRVYNQSTNLLLFKTNMTAGHSGQSGRYESLKEIALQYTFLLKTLEIKD